ncbi:MAG TPA: cyclopropane-fatty-acyl-phospholipid synthase family protein [Acidobacteriaceae bacterium]|nr:cyclopropane-fatty-acyl-phospholipid synthase family protein [Acidobacteriaceae bacterium]
METAVKRGIAQKLFYRSLAGLQGGCMELCHGSQTEVLGEAGHPLRATMVVHSDRLFRRAVLGGDIGLGEAYMDGDWSSPDLVPLVRIAVRNARGLDSSNRLISAALRGLDRLRHLRRDNTESGSRRNIAYHYDLGNEFYKLFLDESLAYSCAFYETGDDALQRAQENKYARICHKLDLRPEDHLLEIGTGWGGFAAYAAAHYGCRITTTTISRQQHDYSRRRFEPLNAKGARIELLFEDYRRLKGHFNKLVSIEMFEAVGHRHYDEFFSACDRLLTPQGVMLLQTITMNERHFPEYLKQSDWIKKYIFPGAELASVASILRSTAQTGSLQLLHLEDIGEHYALTLREWRRRFMARLDQVRALGFDERFLRMWEFYLAYCEGGFLERYIGDAQLLLAKPAASVAFSQPLPGNALRDLPEQVGVS